MQPTSYAQELEALKTELRHTLARWERPAAPSAVSGSVFSTPCNQNTGIGSVASQSPPRTATSTPATWSPSSTRTMPSSTDRATTHASRLERPLSALSARQMMQELAQAAQRRRELEQKLANDMKQDEARRQGELRNRQRQQRSVWQDAILALRRQRKEILRQIEQETEASQQSSPPNSPPKPTSYDPSFTSGSFALPPRGPTSDPSSASIIAANHALRGRVSTTEDKDQQYSIEGVVTLEPLASNQAQQQQQRPPVPRSVAYRTPQGHQVTVLPPMPTKMHDTLNEVFSIQLQFAETMLKLEKSVQMREQLLNHHHSDQGRRHTRQARRRPRPGTYADGSRRYLVGVAEDHELNSENNSDLDYLSSSSASLDASLIRARHEDMATAYSNQSHVAPATPPSSTASSPPHTGSSNATTTGSSHAGPSPEDINKTPSKKLAHGDAKTEAEMDPATKQVRFEYSTPVIAKKFTFENQSDDEESILSFLEGSSVSSSELSDPSFVRAFEKFRCDLRTAKSFLFAAAAEPGSPPLATARTLFTCDEDVDDEDEDDEEEEVKNEEPPAAPVKARGTPAWKQQQASRLGSSAAQVPISDAAGNAPQESQSELLDATELMERRRQLCLDIQAESAHLLLSFGSTNAPQRERIKSTLIALRAQLQTVDTRLSQLNT